MSRITEELYAGKFQPGDYFFRTGIEGWRWKLRAVGVSHRSQTLQLRAIEKYRISNGEREYQRFPMNRIDDEHYTFDHFIDSDENWGFSRPSNIRLEFKIEQNDRKMNIVGEPPYDHYNVTP